MSHTLGELNTFHLDSKIQQANKLMTQKRHNDNSFSESAPLSLTDLYVKLNEISDYLQVVLEKTSPITQDNRVMPMELILNQLQEQWHAKENKEQYLLQKINALEERMEYLESRLQTYQHNKNKACASPHVSYRQAQTPNSEDFEEYPF